MTVVGGDSAGGVRGALLKAELSLKLTVPPLLLRTVLGDVDDMAIRRMVFINHIDLIFMIFM